ncbi:MAG: hypothetical protein ACRCUJ_13340 [Phocaeicola sp.]
MCRLLLVWLICSILPTNLLGNESTRRLIEIDPETFLSENEFSYFDEKVTIRFNLARGKESTDFSFFLLSATTSQKETIYFILDGEPKLNSLNLLFGKNMTLTKKSIPIGSSFFEATSIPILIEFDMRKDLVKLCVGENNTIEIGQTGLSVDYGYKFAIHLNTTPSNHSIQERDGPTIQNFSVEAVQDSRKGNSIIWYIVIIVLDILIFSWMYYRHRKLKKEGSSNLNEVSLSSPIYLSKPLLPTKSAIYLFGGMRIYNKEGEDITKRFSPILKELLALLILHSDKKGISAEKMKSYLWLDKTVASARNNRAVNLGKLRNLLTEVGDFEITNDDSYWSIQTKDAFIDYLQYRTTLGAVGLRSRSEIELLCSLTAQGNILPEQPYEWLDELKGNISNELFDKFLAYSATMNENHTTDIYIGMADVMLKFESINEQALSLKCRAYVKSGRHSAAKTFYDKFCQEYKQVYGETFTLSFADLLKMAD